MGRNRDEQSWNRREALRVMVGSAGREMGEWAAVRHSLTGCPVLSTGKGAQDTYPPKEMTARWGDE